jgi:hypothetical protein
VGPGQNHRPLLQRPLLHRPLLQRQIPGHSSGPRRARLSWTAALGPQSVQRPRLRCSQSTHARTRARTHTQAHARKHAHISTRTHERAHKHTHARTRTHTQYVHAHKHTHASTRTQAHLRHARQHAHGRARTRYRELTTQMKLPSVSSGAPDLRPQSSGTHTVRASARAPEYPALAPAPHARACACA